MKVLKYAVICCFILMFAAFPIAFMVSSQTSPIIALQPFVSGLTAPLLATNAKDGTRRLFIVQQGGIIKVVQPGSNTPTDFLNITSKIVSGGEQGLLGLTFHPQFTTTVISSSITRASATARPLLRVTKRPTAPTRSATRVRRKSF